MTVIKTLVS